MVNTSILSAFKRMWLHIVKELNNKSNINHNHYVVKTATLTIDNWLDMTQTINVDGVKQDNAIVIAPDPINKIAYDESGVYCNEQTSGSLTFKCTEVPTENLLLNILCFY